ncbi:PepSY domain-containing protein [Roseibium aggregatum]|uniref:NADPH--hemoprotein reductase n=1 Tax=Roseibium aggregatum TaxID=187304 RepID=A0A926P3Z9_9HYPH|nr:PepSY domain-containing protein [Roseibium aggregatum]MBD1548848.1 N-acetylglucosamine transferase [Roseibium aggregatum]
MIRALHRWPGLLAALLLTVLALSGAALSLFPAVETLSAPRVETGLSVAELAQRIQDTYPGVEQIRRAPSGRITAYWFDNGRPGSAVIDPSTGSGIAAADPNQTERWLTNLHRSLFLDDTGRIVSALGAGTLLVLTVSGIFLVARRAGGWRRWFSPLKGPLSGRLHVEIARLSVAGLLISSATALWMTANTFDLLPGGPGKPAFPAEVSGKAGIALTKIPTLVKTPVADLRDLTFPYPDDATDVFTLKTDTGTGYIDQGSGDLLAWADLSAWDRVSETVYMLHTGQGASLLGLVLGLMALGLPVMGGTGLAVWAAGRRGRPRLRGNVPANKAETIVLVGSEGGSTWGFAATLQAELKAVGQSVHTAAMSTFNPDRYPKARRIVILAATYGDGDAPASAKGFLERLSAMNRAPDAPLAVLGFGDRSFPAFCAFAEQVMDAAQAKGWQTLIPMETVDRQSPQDFARWGRTFGTAIGVELELNHQPEQPAATGLTLVSRRDYGAEVQAPTAILRFEIPRASLWSRLIGRGFPKFAAGDLLGIIPEGSTLPRFYSLASGAKDGFVEIAVRKHPGGLCSGQLMDLEPGATVNAFIRHNPGFRPGRGKAPLILIGAGTGIGPLAGFIRNNTAGRPIHLFFGARHPESDFLYSEELTEWSRDGRLGRVATAFSRGKSPVYVQDALRRDATEITQLIAAGARIMICGGRDMARGVAESLTDILAPAGLTPAILKAEGRYVEDVY